MQLDKRKAQAPDQPRQALEGLAVMAHFAMAVKTDRDLERLGAGAGQKESGSSIKLPQKYRRSKA
ncbi:hypothetical protein [Planomicrobium sp. CPCC 101110]|uniref:hypothetical protein n=1 Tax=Planomicrobium sp. CPCC 101110 TaxID=2599619 RepID=UPI0011B5F93E|nr:hypothetical protein [Planomicrobium sp. CPCC 101110]TWT27493.1 hypothetical protein FQV30_02975 [Planomicrobium sp. CPCC 101110]